jgi:hypothetical protein
MGSGHTGRHHLLLISDARLSIDAEGIRRCVVAKGRSPSASLVALEARF